MVDRYILSFLLLGLVGMFLAPRAASAQESTAQPRFSVLVFSKTNGYRHASIGAGKKALQRLGNEHNFRVDVTEDSTAFTTDRLNAYDVVVFLNSSGDVFNEAQQQALKEYIQAGHGFVGVHAAATTEYEWSWYEGLVGAYFDDHPSDPNVRSGTVNVSDPAHPSTAHLPVQWERDDEWYNYRSNPRGDVHVLATVDESTYEGGTMGSDHPIAWAHQYDGGRAFYTGGGHTDASYNDSLFVRHLLGGIEWAAGEAEGDVRATVENSFEKVVLDSTTTDPIELDVAPDGRVFYIERRGIIKVWHPDTETISVAGYLPVTIVNEDGLMGLTLGPNFADTGWMYLYYAPPEGQPRNQLSRFRVKGDSVDLESEQKILTVPTQRKECCHTGGSLAFGPEGKNLYLSTGDDTNPFASDGFAPIDERPDRAPWDAQRTSANTQDLRGKILRITPQSDGSYTIPEGNLFSDADEGRPEIYVMGTRNPYRISVDDETGWLYWGDVGPDAGAPDSARGPAGHDEINQAREAGYYGWPYFVGDNKAYHDYDFAADTSGSAFDPAAPVNDSPNNTGARVLPPAQPPIIWYPYGPSDEFPEMDAGSRTAMAGPIYHYDEEAVGPHGLPAYFDGSLLIYEWARNWIKEVTFGEDGRPAAINPLFTEKTFIRPMDMELGPDGRVYLIEWGNNFGGGPNSKLVRLDYYGSSERPPVAGATALPASGDLPLTVTLRADTNAARNDDVESYEWDVDGDGTPEYSGSRVSHTFDVGGSHTVRLTVTDEAGHSATDEVTVLAGNTRPTVTVDWPVNGGVVPFDASVPYRVSVTDPEDETIADDRVGTQSLLGRDSHELPQGQSTGRTGTFRVSRTEHYKPKEKLFAAFEARYTDGGSSTASAAEGRAKVMLQPQQAEAELATTIEGLEEESFGEGPPTDQRTVLTAEADQHLAYAPVNLRNVSALTFHVAPMAGGWIEVRQGAPDGPLLGEAGVAPTASDTATSDSTSEHDDEESPPVGADNADWTNVTVSITDPGGAHPLYVVFRGVEDKPLLKLDWIRFDGPGMTRMPTWLEED